MKLLIAIPAYNEEGSIQSIISRSLDARRHIISHSPVTEVDITVVSDGSSDRTVELAGAYKDRIRLIAFPKNRGYGAAIKEAWRQSDADLLGFLDADGTCDPTFFAQLCQTMESETADVVIGCRMNEESKMPLVRRVGNVVFARILSVFSSSPVRDTASGMRVIRRCSLPKLLPLPDGLHFTPAMSARAMLGDGIKLAEINMPYHERKGESKLRIGADGFRFLKVILEAALLYRPSRPLALLGLACLFVAVALMIMPTIYYLMHRSLVEWMIYRFVVSHLAGTTACLLFCASYLSRKMVNIALPGEAHHSAKPDPLSALFSTRLFWVIPWLAMTIGGLLVIPSFLELVRTAHTYEHWSRFIAMSFLFLIAIILIVTRILDYILDLVAEHLAFVKSQKAAEVDQPASV
jgi:glycosyltransferase involved in cell wall biosynthesis